MKLFTKILALLVFSTSTLIASSEQLGTAAGTLTLTPVLHSTLALEYQGTTIFVDPYGGAERFQGLDDPDLILITDIHGDHLNLETLTELNTQNTTFVIPKAAEQQLEDIDHKEIIVIANGERKDWSGIGIEAIPMYNLPETAESRHVKGRGNGYVLSIGDKRLYFSGDTEDIPEMRALKHIDYAFICMNLPYTMDINQAADAVLEFKPRVVYPYHYRGQGGQLSDVDAFESLVHAKAPSIEVRIRDWYAK